MLDIVVDDHLGASFEPVEYANPRRAGRGLPDDATATVWWKEVEDFSPRGESVQGMWWVGPRWRTWRAA